MSRDVLDLIDSTLEDYATSDDAMRWAPDAPDPGCVHSRPPTMMWDPHTTATWPTWDAMIRERFGPVLDQVGVILTDWQYEVIGRVLKVRVRVTPSRAEAERQIRLRRMHTEYHRRGR